MFISRFRKMCIVAQIQSFVCKVLPQGEDTSLALRYRSDNPKDHCGSAYRPPNPDDSLLDTNKFPQLVFLSTLRRELPILYIAAMLDVRRPQFRFRPQTMVCGNGGKLLG